MVRLVAAGRFQKVPPPKSLPLSLFVIVGEVNVRVCLRDRPSIRLSVRGGGIRLSFCGTCVEETTEGGESADVRDSFGTRELKVRPEGARGFKAGFSLEADWSIWLLVGENWPFFGFGCAFEEVNLFLFDSDWRIADKSLLSVSDWSSACFCFSSAIGCLKPCREMREAKGLPWGRVCVCRSISSRCWTCCCN